MKTKQAHQLIYVDEAGADNRDDYAYGYCEIGQRFYALRAGRRTERVSWIAALQQATVMAPLTFQGACHRDLFETWFQHCLMPHLTPGNVIILDNASFHHSQLIEELAAEVGCEIWYLPPYSPDLNAIENWWFVLKNWMRQRWDEFDSFRECVDAAFINSPNVIA